MPAAGRSHLVTSPASFVSCMSPWRPTTACERGERARGRGERLRRMPQRHRMRCGPSAHHELVDVHGGVDGHLASEVGLKLGFAHARLGVVRQQLGQALHAHASQRRRGARERRARVRTWIPMATVVRQAQERASKSRGSRTEGGPRLFADSHLALPSALLSNMVNKKSAFIDKRRAATYHLVASTRGPDEDGDAAGDTTQRVFTRVAVRCAALRCARHVPAVLTWLRRACAGRGAGRGRAGRGRRGCGARAGRAARSGRVRRLPGMDAAAAAVVRHAPRRAARGASASALRRLRFD